jgi:predicted nucleotidyltransferase
MSGNPCAGQTVSPLAELELILGCHWKNIEDARQKAETTLEQLSKIIEGMPSADTSVIVHGSLARYECTQGSDLDWTFLVDGEANAGVQETFIEIKKALSKESIFKELGLKPPGEEGTFGALAFSQPIVLFIGGEEDSNSNTTRRVLLLLEALPIGERRVAFDRVRKNILKRYIDEDRRLLQKRQDDESRRWVPLFLLNDFARYWRTMAVDFAYKQFDRGNDGYALRNIKLGLSRKLLFASGLLACFWCDPIISRNGNQEPSKQSLINCLDTFLSLTPLERIALFFTTHLNISESKLLRETAKELFCSYDEFLGLLNDSNKRNRLKKLRQDEEESDEVFREAWKTRKVFRKAIQDMFLGGDSPLRNFSIERGVF